jgi:hypothetical protein
MYVKTHPSAAREPIGSLIQAQFSTPNVCERDEVLI